MKYPKILWKKEDKRIIVDKTEYNKLLFHYEEKRGSTDKLNIRTEVWYSCSKSLEIGVFLDLKKAKEWKKIVDLIIKEYKLMEN